MLDLTTQSPPLGRFWWSWLLGYSFQEGVTSTLRIGAEQCPRSHWTAPTLGFASLHLSGRHAAQVGLGIHSSVEGQGQTPLAAEGEGDCREPALGPECGHQTLVQCFLSLGMWEGRLVVDHHISSPKRGVLSGGGWGAAFSWEPILLFSRPHLSRGRQTGLEGEYS